MIRILLFALIFQLPFFIKAQSIMSLETTGAYSFNLETPGVNFRTYYFFNEHLHLGAEYTHLFTHTEIFADERIETNAEILDLNANYFYKLNNHFIVYGVLGLDYTTEKETSITSESRHNSSEDAVGYNIGAGFEIPITHQIAFLTEFTHTFSDLRDNLLF